MKQSRMPLIAVLLSLACIGVVRADAEVPPEPQFPGRLEGTGTHFELTDSAYLNVTLDSSEPIRLVLESVPKTVSLRLELASDVASAQITLGGFPPATTYYKYEDDYHNLETITTDENGNYAYTQDLSSPHLVIFQTEKSTKFIRDDATGGDCTSIGNWDSATRTCTLTTDLTETIQIDSDHITLDGNGHTITGTHTGHAGVALLNRTGVTVKNVNIDGFTVGINVFTSVAGRANTLIGNTVSGGNHGILLTTGGNTLIGNTALNNADGISLGGSGGNTLTGNVASNNSTGFNINYIPSTNNTLTNNIASNNNRGLRLFYCSNNVVYNNSFINNTTQVYVEGGGGHVFNMPAPDGGNYWSDYDTPAEGCDDADNDGFCDAPYAFSGGQDDLPWTTQMGWEDIRIYDDATGGDCILIGTWDSGTKTCTLTTDFNRTIHIESDGITLDGNGHTLAGSGTGNGVNLDGRTGVTIKNLNVQSFSAGIRLANSSGNTLTNNTTDSNRVYGIDLSHSSGNTLSGNTVSNTSGGSHEGIGIRLYGAWSNTLIGNTTDSSKFYGIGLYNSRDNTFANNTVTNNCSYGIYFANSYNNAITSNIFTNNSSGILFTGSPTRNNVVTKNTFIDNGVGVRTYGSSNNQVYNNNFIDNRTQASVQYGSNVFNLAAPDGGNYWSDYDTPAEGCSNLDGDSFCDDPYVFTGGQDNLPWTTQNGWEGDTTPPNITTPGDITAEATGPSGAVVTYTVTAEDDVDGPVIPDCSPPSGFTFSLGGTTVTCTATDSAGNTSTASFTVTVQDTTLPTVAVTSLSAPQDGFLPAQSFLAFPATVGSQPVTVDVAVSDAVGINSVIVNGIPAVGGLEIWTAVDVPLNVGPNTITALATDTSGNVGEDSVQVILDLDLDDDGIHNNVDKAPPGPFEHSTKFSDEALGGVTSGHVLDKCVTTAGGPQCESEGFDTGVIVEVTDAPDPDQGVRVVVSGPDNGYARVKIDGSTGTFDLEPGEHILPDEYIFTSGTVTLEVLQGRAKVEFTINNAPVVVGVEGTVIFHETIVDENLIELKVTVLEGTVTVNGIVVPPGESFIVPIPVRIDIKPGSDPNSINPETKGKVPVAILSTPDFDAPIQADKTWLTFGRTGDEESLAFCTKSAEDVNGDGLLDQVCHFNAQDTGFQQGDTEGILRGETVDGIPIEGRDSVRIVGK